MCCRALLRRDDACSREPLCSNSIDAKRTTSEWKTPAVSETPWIDTRDWRRANSGQTPILALTHADSRVPVERMRSSPQSRGPIAPRRSCGRQARPPTRQFTSATPSQDPNADRDIAFADPDEGTIRRIQLVKRLVTDPRNRLDLHRCDGGMTRGLECNGRGSHQRHATASVGCGGSFDQTHSVGSAATMHLRSRL
jgi:hypothetical protein